jgi:hypothetical protein
MDNDFGSSESVYWGIADAVAGREIAAVTVIGHCPSSKEVMVAVVVGVRIGDVVTRRVPTVSGVVVAVALTGGVIVKERVAGGVTDTVGKAVLVDEAGGVVCVAVPTIGTVGTTVRSASGDGAKPRGPKVATIAKPKAAREGFFTPQL